MWLRIACVARRKGHRGLLTRGRSKAEAGEEVGERLERGALLLLLLVCCNLLLQYDIARSCLPK